MSYNLTTLPSVKIKVNIYDTVTPMTNLVSHSISWINSHMHVITLSLKGNAPWKVVCLLQKSVDR